MLFFRKHFPSISDHSNQEALPCLSIQSAKWKSALPTPQPATTTVRKRFISAPSNACASLSAILLFTWTIWATRSGLPADATVEYGEHQSNERKIRVIRGKGLLWPIANCQLLIADS